MTNLPPLPPLPPLPGKNNPENNGSSVPSPGLPVPPSYPPSLQKNQPPAQSDSNAVSEQPQVQTFEQTTTKTPEPPKKNKALPWIIAGGIVLVLIIVGLLVAVPRILGSLGSLSPIPGPTVTIPMEDPQGQAPSESEEPEQALTGSEFNINSLDLKSGQNISVFSPDSLYWEAYGEPKFVADEKYGNSSTATSIVTDVVPGQNCAVQSIIFDEPEPPSLEFIQFVVEGFNGSDPGQPKKVTPLGFNGLETEGYQYQDLNIKDRTTTVTAVTAKDSPDLLTFTMTVCEDPTAQATLNDTQFDANSKSAIFYNLK